MGRSPFLTGKNGHSLNLATRRALVDGAASRHRGSPLGQSRYPETGERTRPERERRFMRSTPPSPGLRPRDFVSMLSWPIASVHRDSTRKAVKTDNDPSAGSPTETLLRLLLPLNATVWSSSRKPGRVTRQAHSPRTSLKRSIGSSDGRCVQRAGT